ncbi:MAG: S9 family peptidase [Chloroflexota bacterium]
MSNLRAVEPDDLFRMRFLQGATWGQSDGLASGRFAVYALTHYDAATDSDISCLWLVDVETGEQRQLTYGNDSSPALSPDGQTVAFVGRRGEARPQIYLLPLAGGEAWQLTDLPQGVAGKPVWSPDGNQIAFCAPPEKAHDPNKPYRVTRHVYRFDAMGYLDGAVLDIYVVAVADGVVRRLTNDSTHNSNPQWSPDGRKLLYLAAMQSDVHYALFPRVCVLTLMEDEGLADDGRRTTDDGGGTTDDDGVAVVGGRWSVVCQDVLGDWGRIANVVWLPDGERIAFIGQPHGLLIGSKSDLFVARLDGATPPENRSAGLLYGVGQALQDDMPTALVGLPPILLVENGRFAFVQVQRGGNVHLYRVALAGAELVEPVLEGDRSCLPLAVSDDERQLLFATTDFATPLDLAVADVEGGNERGITAVNAHHLSQLHKPVVERMLFAGEDGVEVEGWMLMPAVGEAPFPTVLYIHGGPHGAFGSAYHFDTQLLLGAGFAVLMVNHRASTGYGNSFSTAIKGDWGHLDYTDLMAGVDEAIARGWADADRLGVCGLSGGGNLSCWIVGQTDRFKAAVPENPVTNWVSFYGTSDIGVWFAVEQLGGHPHEIPEIYAQCSPITYAHRCTTPTLLVQGEHDWRCPAEQGEQFYNVLKANGCVAEMVRLPNASHGGAIEGTPANRRAQNEALLEWMQRFLNNGVENVSRSTCERVGD